MQILMADLFSMNKLNYYCKHPCTLKCRKNDVLGELAFDNKRTEKFLEFCCTHELKNIPLALIMLMAHE